MKEKYVKLHKVKNSAKINRGGAKEDLDKLLKRASKSQSNNGN